MTRLVDLSHPWSVQLPPFVGMESAVLKATHRFASHRTFMQRLETGLHTGTHIDAPNHFVEGAGDMSSIPLEQLYGEGVIVDISDDLDEWTLIRPEHITRKAEVRPGDILIYYTGWSRYYATGKTPDETKYMFYYPGGGPELAQWIVDLKLKWWGFDCIASDHPMYNYPMRVLRPDLVREYEERTGVRVDEAFPLKHLAVTHRLPFSHRIVHVENIGGDIERVLNRRCTIGAFPWNFVGGEACICRVVAFLAEEQA